MHLFHGSPFNYTCDSDATAKGAPHGLCTTLKDQVNEDLLAFIKA